MIGIESMIKRQPYPGGVAFAEVQVYEIPFYDNRTTDYMIVENGYFVPDMGKRVRVRQSNIYMPEGTPKEKTISWAERGIDELLNNVLYAAQSLLEVAEIKGNTMNDIDQGRIEHLRKYIQTLAMMQQYLLQEGDN